jgi:putative phosphoribosyl transferase
MGAAVWGTMGDRPAFRDRYDAGERLGRALQGYRTLDTLVLGIPRGGVPVAATVAQAIGAEMDIIVARKLGAPGSPELAIGAVTANGGQFLNEDVIAELGITPAFVDIISKDQRAEAQRRDQRFRGSLASPRIEGRIVIIVDDGLATGSTMIAAVRSVRLRSPSRIVVAVPVGSRQACATLEREADVVICLYEPEPFIAVGLHYERFRQIEDDEVIAILEAARASARISNLAKLT